MREAQNIEDILNGYPVKEGKRLYARAGCPCCGRRWFVNAAYAYNVRKETWRGKEEYVCTVNCDSCNYAVDSCSFVSEEELRESYKNFGKE